MSAIITVIIIRARVRIESKAQARVCNASFNSTLPGKTYFEGQSKAGVLPQFNADRESARALRAKHQASNQQSLSSYTFTDLAQMVCKVSRGSRYVDVDIDSDTDELEEYEADLEEDAQEVGYASEPTAGILDQVLISILIHTRSVQGNKRSLIKYIDLFLLSIGIIGSFYLIHVKYIV